MRPVHLDLTNLIWLHLLTQSRFLALTGFKASTEVYAIVRGPSVCIRAFVDLPSVKFCGKAFGIPVPCGFEWARLSFDIVVRRTHYVPAASHTTTEAHVAPLSHLPRTVHGH